jgi:glycosyltransferase involved in cell wall biosynthesis
MITVLMPAYNAARFLDESVRSILEQTFRDLELLLIDDASSDDSAAALSRFRDPRLRVLRNSRNIGIAATLNRGIEEACGEYIARMDADDIACPQRLERQLNFMERHPDVGVLGTWVRLFGDQPRVIVRQPIGADVVKAYLVFDNPLFHPTVMMRRSVLLERNLRYNPEFSRTEDYELWMRAATCCRLDNLPEALVRMRVHSANITTTTRETMTMQTGVLLKRQLAQLGLHVTEEEAAFHHDVSRGRRVESSEALIEAEKWFIGLQERNRVQGVFSTEALAVAVGMVWFRLCLNSANLGAWVWRKYRSSPLSSGYRPQPGEVGRFFASILWNMVSMHR